MVEGEIALKGNVALVGFEKLAETEIIAVEKIVAGYIKKMSEYGTYKEMKLTLQQHPHGKSFKHEVICLAFFNEGRFATNVTEWNLFTAVSEACGKVLKELEHRMKKTQRHDKLV